MTSAIGWSQTKLIEKVSKSADEVVIPYEKYELSNGLTLVIHEDHSDPLVHVDVTYHVGSAREELQKSGFAHFFEHMMFQGSENVADEEHFKLISRCRRYPEWFYQSETEPIITKRHQVINWN